MENLDFDWDGMRRIGILGGTFDPIHNGHLAAVDAALQRLDIDRLILIPAGQPPHKTGREISSGHHRYMMCLLAAAREQRVAVSYVELSRGGRSYTIETLRQLRQWTGPETELVFVAGADMALDLPNWYQPDAILDEARFVAVHRPGYDLDRLHDVLGDARAGKIQRLAVDTPDVSGTQIRRRVSNSESIEGMTVPAVSAYIRAAGLYRHRDPAHEG